MKRIDWIDVAKGYGILLVMLGHLELSGIKVPLYAFHMPLFFFLSGMVFTTKSCFSAFVRAKMRRIVLPYFCLGIPLVLSHIFLTDELTFSTGDITQEMVRLVMQKRYMTIWFLASLLMLNVFSYPLARLCSCKRVGWGMSLLMGVAGLVLWRCHIYVSYWNADIALVCMPFFYGGYCLRDVLTRERVSVWLSRVQQQAAIVVLAVLTYVLAVFDAWLTDNMVDLYHSNFTIEGLTHLTALLGIATTVLLSMRWQPSTVKYVGQHSLIFFAWHQFMVLPGLKWAALWLGVFQSERQMEPIAIQLLLLGMAMLVLTLMNEIVLRTRLRNIIG